MIFRDTQTDRHFIIIYISSSSGCHPHRGLHHHHHHHHPHHHHYHPQGTTHIEDYIPTYEHTWAPAPLPTSAGSTASTTWPDRSTPGDHRDVEEWKSLTCTSCSSATTTYADWSREQTPGYHQTQHHQHHQHHQQAAHNHWKKMVSINPNISTGAGPTSSR